MVRDITDINHPSTVATIDVSSPPGFAPTFPRFANSSEVSYVDADGNLVRLAYSASSKSIVARCADLFDWSPDGTSVVYVSQTDSGMTIHKLSASGDRVLGSAPPGGAGGCETIEGCAIANTVDFRLSYSRDGNYVALVTNGFGKSSFRIWSTDGTQLASNDSQGATMSIWSGNNLYFDGSGGVVVWRGGMLSSFLPGVAWIKPQGSPAGGQIVYAVRDSAGWAHTQVVDTITGKTREIKIARAQPVYLTSRYVWYRGERECTPSDGCGPNPPFHPFSGKTYIYDLQTGTETESIITGVADVWPHAG